MTVERGGARPPSERAAERSALRTIVERMADGIVIVDSEGLIRFVNPAAEALFGRQRAELVGEQFGFPLVPGETTEIDVVRRGGPPLTAELRVVAADWQGQGAWLISLRDVTDRKQGEERARQLAREQAARAEAEAASQAKSEFLAVMSHELRTPLNAVLGYAELLDLGIAGPLTNEQRQQLGRISASGRHLLGLVNEVLDLARVEAGRLAVDRSPSPAVDAAEEAFVLIQPLAEARGLTLAELPPGLGDLAYIGDEDRVRQILVNLLSNAVKFTDAGGRISLHVEVTSTPDPEARLRGDGEWLCFRVTDTGIGLAADHLDAVFAPFVQAQSGHTRGKEGTGLGLTISRRLARLMGGDLTVRSTLGRGSVFTLWLPAAHTGAAPQTEKPGRVELRGREPRVQGLAEVGEAMLRETDSILDAFVARMRSEPSLPAAAELKFSQLADHAATLIADVAGALVVLEESGGQPSTLLADGAEIQRLIAERHGAQRARLGWTRDALRRESAFLREEVERTLRRCFLGESGDRLTEAIAVSMRLLGQAEEASLRALERAVHLAGDKESTIMPRQDAAPAQPPRSSGEGSVRPH
jgi:signal transduction histidine kinase